MAERFTNKVVLVTGSADGLGRALALGFAREGAELILADVNVAGMEETAAQLHALGAKSSVHRVDLALEEEIKSFAADMGKHHDRLDVLYNNAGLAYGEISYGFETLSQAKWLNFFAINTVAPLLLAHALRDLLAVGPGSIINQSSMAAYMPGTAYGITKNALNAMTYGMANSFAKQGIRVNAVAPGLMETPASRAGVAESNYTHIQAMQLLKLHGTAEHIVDLGLFLASDDAKFITNEIMHCDAGHPLRGFRG